MPHIENVVGERFTFIMFSLKTRKGTGSPIRAIALVPEDEEITWELHS